MHCTNCTTGSGRTVASHKLMFMVRGIITSLEFPYAQFTTVGATADTLYPIVWEAVQRLEADGFKVVALTCDGASPNRKFFKMHGSNSTNLIYKTENIYSDDSRDIILYL